MEKKIFFARSILVQQKITKFAPSNFENHSGCSAVRLAYLLWEQRVAGSNPATPTVKNRSLRYKVSFCFFKWIHDLHTKRSHCDGLLSKLKNSAKFLTVSKSLPFSKRDKLLNDNLLAE